MKTIITRLILYIGKWLHGITSDQWRMVLEWVKSANLTGMSSSEKLEWVKAQLGSESLKGAALNWLIETAVGFIRK